MTRSPAIEVEFNHAIAILRFNQPDERNPLSLTALSDLSGILGELTARSDVKVIIFTGAGEVFASGANIRELEQLSPASAVEFSHLGQQVFQTVADARQVTIAAINGYCMGGALDLALACDVRVASRNAIFAHPGATLGIITGWGGTQRLPRTIGRARAMEMFLTTQRIDSESALLMGLVTRIEDPVMNAAMAVAAEILGGH